MTYNRSVRVSDHAMLRYLERVEGFDFDAVRQRILTAELIAAVKAGARTMAINGHTFVIEDGSVVTVLGPWQRPMRRVPRNRGGRA